MNHFLCLRNKLTKPGRALITKKQLMKILNLRLVLAAIALMSVSLQACKTKKLAAKPAPVVEAPKPAPAAPPVEKAPVETPAAAPVEPPAFNFSNVQFEFNSGVLKTASFSILDKAATEIKKDPSAKFTINGHSSAEGTPEHNMSLSVDRANSVKSYLVNAGINAANLSIKGHGADAPMTSNDTEAGKVLNRRVEIKKD
jgi:outer membrane protein OmpA-like peptidoglycan-associated protein